MLSIVSCGGWSCQKEIGNRKEVEKNIQQKQEKVGTITTKITEITENYIIIGHGLDCQKNQYKNC